jgi:hypothetical protein
MNIGGVVATVIHTIIGLNFVRTAPWEAMFLHNLAHAVFLLMKYPAVPNLWFFCIFSTTAAFQLWPTLPVAKTACRQKLLAEPPPSHNTQP